MTPFSSNSPSLPALLAAGRAADLAAAGAPGEALAALDAALEQDEAPPLLLLKGKILAQAGRFADAAAALERVPPEAPERPAAQAALARARQLAGSRWQQWRHHFGTRLHWAGWVAALALLAAAVVFAALFFQEKRQLTALADMERLAASVRDVSGQVNALSEALERQRQAADRQQPVLDSLLRQSAASQALAARSLDTRLASAAAASEASSQGLASLASQVARLHETTANLYGKVPLPGQLEEVQRRLASLEVQVGLLLQRLEATGNK